MRYDALSVTGNKLIQTAAMERLANRGMVFHRHHSPNQICSPSRATMATGLYPRTHGLTRNGIALTDQYPTLWSMMKTKGLATHAIGKLHYQPLLASASHNMPESLAFWGSDEAAKWSGPYFGFDEVELVLGEANESVKAGHYAHWLKHNHPEAVRLYEPQASSPAPSDLKELWRNAVPAELHYTNWIADRAVAAIEKHSRDGGLCVLVSFPDPHHPFSPPAPYCDMYSPESVAKPVVIAGELDRMPAYLRDGDDPAQDAYIQPGGKVREQGFMLRTDTISDLTMQRVIAHTYGSVQMIDDAVGRILDAIEGNGLSDDTFVVFTSDHGEFLGDHGLLRKGPPPYRQLLQVPMLFSGPGISGNTASHALTSHLDFVATLATFFDLTPTHQEGLDLSSILTGRNHDVRDHLFAEYHPRADLRVYNQTVITDRWRYTCYPNEPSWGELFDLESDPWEHRNLFGEPGLHGIAAGLRGRLASHMPAAPDAGGIVLGAY